MEIPVLNRREKVWLTTYSDVISRENIDCVQAKISADVALRHFDETFPEPEDN